MLDLETWELLSYVVTVVGLPLAIALFVFEQRKERNNEEKPAISVEQRERTFIIFSMLISLFERAYLLLYEDDMAEKQLRRWRSWEDYMGEWCNRADFRAALPTLLRGEDPEFATYIQKLAVSDHIA
jgi:hypothetical protein